MFYHVPLIKRGKGQQKRVWALWEWFRYASCLYFSNQLREVETKCRLTHLFRRCSFFCIEIMPKHWTWLEWLCEFMCWSRWRRVLWISKIMRGCRADFPKKISPYGGRLILGGFKKDRQFCRSFYDFDGVEIGSFLILILYRNNIIFKRCLYALCIKGLSRFWQYKTPSAIIKVSNQNNRMLEN